MPARAHRVAIPVLALALPLACRTAVEPPSAPPLDLAPGIELVQRGELEQAIGSFTRALELEPMHVKSLQWRGTTRLDRGEARLAVEDFTRALACLATADEAALARWGERREALQGETLRLLALDALGESEAAARDRAQRERILGGSG